MESVWPVEIVANREGTKLFAVDKGGKRVMVYSRNKANGELKYRGQQELKDQTSSRATHRATAEALGIGPHSELPYSLVVSRVGRAVVSAGMFHRSNRLNKWLQATRRVSHSSLSPRA